MPARAGRAGPGRPGRPPASGPVHRVHWLDQVHGAEVVGRRARETGPPERPGVGRRVVTAVFAGPGDGLVSDRTGRRPGRPHRRLCLAGPGQRARGCSAPSTPAGGAWPAGWWRRPSPPCGRWGPTEVVGALGPCIHAECYEFSERRPGRRWPARYGDRVRGRTTAGRPGPRPPGRRVGRPGRRPAPTRSAGVEPAPPVPAVTSPTGPRDDRAARPWSSGRPTRGRTPVTPDAGPVRRRRVRRAAGGRSAAASRSASRRSGARSGWWP